MKRYFNKITSLLIMGILVSTSSKAQQNIDDIISDPNNNYFTIKQKADAWFQEKGIVGTGYKEFKRWEFLVKNIPADGTLLILWP